MTTEPSEQPRKRLSELVGEEVGRQTVEREQDAAYADLPEKFNPADPGGSFAKRITQRIQQQRFEQ
jgi:hypothetical protein